MDVTEATFYDDVVMRSHELPVVVDFWADWCGPCKALTPVLEREVEARSGSLVLVKVDVDANQQLAAHYGISSIPAVKAFKEGKIVSEFVGVRSAQGVADFLDGLIGPTSGERLLEELRASREQPEVVAALDAGDPERALELLLEQARAAEGETRDRVREIMVAIFEELGQEHPLSLRYRRQLASTLY